MMMSEEWMTIIESAEELTQMLLSSETVNDYQKAHDAVYSDADLVKTIQEFTEMKERYEEVQRFGRYHPDYHIVMKSIRVQKRELDLNERIAELRLAENDVQYILDEIGSILAKSVSDAVKVPAGSAFFTDSSCGSGCGTGGSCSCSA
ncbi:YlbF family regulator [Sporosarcina sp. ACRSM]|uniref:YlbF family regulator n=1 Tax=Sporosarcina sp. ACRSM TaxID=2918216 RepID=UPI001EF428EE|nr:YlbF family regulator [Sporosarcina sp. ACRSM]MCG7334170.1 YlbF family regulator [Sporosarcina sp. ACRSM]